LSQAIAYADARALVAPLYRALERVTARVAVVGALRRREALTSPVEILVCLRESSGDLFGGSQLDRDSVRAAVHGWGDVTREAGDVVEAVARANGDLRITVLMVSPDASWGWMVLRHTGPLAFARHVQAALEAQGVRVSPDGTRLLGPSSAIVEADDEAAVFHLAALAQVPPEHRAAVEVAGGDRPTPRLEPRDPSTTRHRGEHQGRGMTIERDDDEP
jgi:DNA polymerase/3'-5' exonuclease PolX